MKYEGLIYKKENGIGTITLNRPEVLNALTMGTLAAIDSIANELKSDKETKVLIITGNGSGFSSGADVSGTLDGLTAEDAGLNMLVNPTNLNYTFNLRRLNQPVIAAINGVTAGMALGLVCACDIRIAAESASFSCAFVKRNLVPDSGVTWFLPRTVGLGMALELAMTGDRIDAQEALRIGLVNRIVPDSELMPAVLALANRMMANPPLAVSWAKKLIYESMDMSLESAFDHEIFLQASIVRTADFTEGVKSFQEKRKPKFIGR
ncbi:MAG: enoyl-CoA hydratase/isomerase family protein [Deltaproteobacteria bacterium]|nr:enoyl-CoA hydratase/isomerase family protein [Deltaproteobacteria bacterium]